ncbi:predicted protein [Plenodomus lingam JN3]|uniref:Predicted protein n=1 Tax=Leptosphaeria maculans (strain JN3 / isolate v23.1.3 / race Av1-4-5-6-7-8) TaxID=985895 RepID=E4ZY16_LEPMJ|nr:predicted protein [Plenodomus lingam JN3]CBX96261.1 predicted protein [Plenodomus lingam JN3]
MANLHGAVKKAWHQPDGWQTGTMDEEEGVHTTATVTVGERWPLSVLCRRAGQGTCRPADQRRG